MAVVKGVVEVTHVQLDENQLDEDFDVVYLGYSKQESSVLQCRDELRTFLA